MSQINDALKRAKASQTPNAPAVPVPTPPAGPAPAKRSNWMWISALLLFIAAACFFAGPLACDHHSAPPAMTNAPAPEVPPPAANVPATNTVAEVEVPPKVQGIFFDPAHPVAIVDKKTVRIGDRVGNFTVKVIARNSVTFQRTNGVLQEIKLGK